MPTFQDGKPRFHFNGDLSGKVIIEDRETSKRVEVPARELFSFFVAALAVVSNEYFRTG
ncbi:MAG TPA: hypothetical protein VGR45_17320 [Stellaceae bacterium]|nr:hypothetical protein [Stellaceae bacterium]